MIWIIFRLIGVAIGTITLIYVTIHIMKYLYYFLVKYNPIKLYRTNKKLNINLHFKQCIKISHLQAKFSARK